MKLYNSEKDTLEFVNLTLNKTTDELNKVSLALRDKFLAMEKAKFIETIEGMATIIKDD